MARVKGRTQDWYLQKLLLKEPKEQAKKSVYYGLQSEIERTNLALVIRDVILPLLEEDEVRNQRNEY